jgi:uncharacterized protein (TIGR03790 family)
LNNMNNKFKLQRKIFRLSLIMLGFLLFGNILKTQAATPTYESVPTASEVLIVYNSAYTTDSDTDGTQDSQEIAEYYVTNRPGVNITSISTVTTETISRTNYNSQIRDPLEAYMTAQGLTDSIKFIVLVKGIPLKIVPTNGSGYGTTDWSSVDAAVCLLYEGDYDINWRQSNPYYNVDTSYTKAYRFDTDHFTNNSGVTLNYLVTRIDGYSVSNMEAIVIRGVGADTSGSGYWIIDDNLKNYDRMSTAFTNLDALSRNINPDPWSDTIDYIITNVSGSVIGYTSHGIHASSSPGMTGMGDGYVSNSPANANHLDFTLLNGAVFSTYESYNGYGFTASTQSSHGQVAEWIEIGGSGGIGNVYEPWSSAIANESIFMPEYTIGYTWAEAAYMSLAYMDFVTVVVGDPLMIVSEIVAPSAVTATAGVIGNNQIALSWTNPGDGDLVGVKVLRKTGSYSGHSADGTLVYNGANESYTDTDVVNGTTYYYAVFAYDEVPNYSSLGDGSKTTATPSSDTTPPDSVTDISANPGNHQVILNWTNPSNADFVGVRVMQKEGSYSSTYSDGTLVYNGSGTSYTDSGLDNDTTYYYTIFAYDTGPNYSIPGVGAKIIATPYLTESGVTIDVSPPGSIYGFSATPADGQVALAWTNPVDSDFNLVRILRRTDYYPQTFSNGTLVMSAYTTTYTDTDVTNDTTYFYTAFACDQDLNCSVVTSNSQDYATPCSGSCSDTDPETAPTYSSSEPDITPPTEITNFDATAGDESVSLSWTNPFGDNDWVGTILLRKTSSYPNSYSDGTRLYNGQNGGTYTDSDVSNGTTYYYAAFAYDAGGNYTASSTDASDLATPSE